MRGVAYADVNDFTVTNFSVDYYLTTDDPQGQLRAVEHIDVDFTDNNHGILRALPKTYKNLPLNLHVIKVSSDSGAPAQYTTYEDNGNEVLKIGDPNRTVTGAQEYTVEYTMQNVVTFYNDHDELYWNVNGLEWMQPFDHIAATVHLPVGLRLSTNMPLCYAGPEGSRDQVCTIAAHGNLVKVMTTSGLGARETLSFVVGFQKSYFIAPSWQDYLAGYLVPILEFTLPFVGLSVAGFVWWLKRGRDAKGTGVTVPQYDAPDNLTPLEVGTLIDFSSDNRDFTATIIDLAIRKYLRIIETHTTKLGVIKQTNYTLELRNQDWSGLKPWEREFMEGIFGYSAQKSSVQLADLKNDLATTAKNARKFVNASLTTQGYFVSNPTRYVALTAGGALFVPVIGFFIFIQGSGAHAAIFWGFVAGVTVFALFYHFMAARTAKGVAALEHTKGLKLYLEVAEKDRIKMLQSPDAPYAAKTSAPTQTVELFEKLLPYAIVLKVEKEWAAKFDNLYVTPPDWYAGNYSAFTAGYLVGSLGTSFNSAMVTSFSPPRSSSSSGFGGGGFSGGGGGGGGGGGW